MDRISPWLKKILFPGGKLVLLLVVLGAVCLYCAFATWLEKTPFVYFAYVLSAYALTVLAAWFVTNAVKYRRFNSPVLSAAKMVSLTTALVSIFTLETAMLSSFGSSYPYEKLMTASTAGGVWTMVFCMAVYMVIHPGKRLDRSTPTP